jgi:glycosyl-4,4'-diaponeurosporenoate acyltransferase
VSPLGRLGVDVLAWGVLQGSLGYLVHRLPVEVVMADNWLWRERPIEAGGRLYAQRLGIKRWKHLLPDAGGVFPGGFARRHLARRDRAYLEQFVAETRRAELNHWLAIAATPAFTLWNPPVAMPFMLLYALAANLPCIAAQRYNRIRLIRVGV